MCVQTGARLARDIRRDGAAATRGGSHRRCPAPALALGAGATPTALGSNRSAGVRHSETDESVGLGADVRQPSGFVGLEPGPIFASQAAEFGADEGPKRERRDDHAKQEEQRIASEAAICEPAPRSGDAAGRAGGRQPARVAAELADVQGRLRRQPTLPVVVEQHAELFTKRQREVVAQRRCEACPPEAAGEATAGAAALAACAVGLGGRAGGRRESLRRRPGLAVQPPVRRGRGGAEAWRDGQDPVR